MATGNSMFKTTAGQERYFSAYDETLRLWSVTVEPVAVSTRFGPTHVNTCGPQNAPPVVLLHAAALSSTMWYPNAAALSREFRLYAPDVIGEMGKSVAVKPAGKMGDFVAWLADVFDALGLRRAHLAGLSAGGALALSFAAARPERVDKLILLSPASLLRIRPGFYLRLARALLPFLSAEQRQAMILGVASPGAAPAIKQLLTPTDFQYRMFFPPVATNAELKQIAAPTLLLLGERESIYDPNTALRRAEKLIPNLQASLLPGAGHALSLDQPEVVNSRILEFLRK